MVIRAEDLKNFSEAELEALLRQSYQLDLDMEEKAYRKELEEYEKSLKILQEKYPFIVKVVTQMTQEEKGQLIEWFVKTDTSFLVLANAVNPSPEFKVGFETYCQSLRNQYWAMTASEFQRKLADTFPEHPDPGHESELDRIRTENEKQVYLAIDKKDILSPMLGLIEDYAKRSLKQGKQVFITVDHAMTENSNDSQADYLYTNEEMEAIVGLNNRLIASGMEQYIRVNELTKCTMSADFADAWSVKDVLEANNQIDNIVSFLKKSNYSPFEKMLFIHAYVTHNYEYNDGSLEECRVLPGIVKNKKIVCSGYASFIKAIIDKLDDPDLKCDIVGCELYSRGLVKTYEGGHCHNLIHIKDPKYNIDGSYVEDATWDSKTKKTKTGRGFAHCLFSVKDLQQMEDLVYNHKFKQSRFDTLIADRENVEGDSEPTYSRKTPELIARYADRSTPIPLETFKKGLHAMYLQTKNQYHNDHLASKKVDQMIDWSAYIASKSFRSTASSAFRKIRVDKKLVARVKSTMQPTKQ